MPETCIVRAIWARRSVPARVRHRRHDGRGDRDVEGDTNGREWQCITTVAGADQLASTAQVNQQGGLRSTQTLRARAAAASAIWGGPAEATAVSLPRLPRSFTVLPRLLLT
jgi:hypothetical protein